MKAYTKTLKKGGDIALHMLKCEIDRITLASLLGGTRWIEYKSKSEKGLQRKACWVPSNVDFSKVVGHGILQTFPDKLLRCFTNFRRGLHHQEEEVPAFAVKGLLVKKNFGDQVFPTFSTVIMRV